jgi:hypothetical protein
MGNGGTEAIGRPLDSVRKIFSILPKSLKKTIIKKGAARGIACRIGLGE